MYVFLLLLLLLTLLVKKNLEKLWVKNEIDHMLGTEDERDYCFSSMKKNARMQDSMKNCL